MSKVIVKNRRAFFEYTLLDKFVAGLKLKGSEVKSIRNGHLNMSESFCVINNGEIFVQNLHISEFKRGGIHNNHEPLRVRKLLLTKKEILHLDEKSKQKGLTIVPLTVLLTKEGFIKLEIALAKGKKLHDKRESIKKKDLSRELAQAKNKI